MNKFKKATKRIVAVGVSALMVSSAAFAAGLNNYPKNFEDEVTVVVGASAATSDTTAAASIVADLKAEFAGGDKVEISYKKKSNGGETVSAVDTRQKLNFGETLESVNADLEADDVDILEDGSLDNTDFTQEIVLKNGQFDYRIFDEIDGEDTAKAGIYYPAFAQFAEFTLQLDSAVDVDSDSAKDLIGEEMVIMGNEFTVVEIADDKLVLVGGANKISIGEGESKTVDVDGKSYELSIQSVSDTKVLLTVNGQSKSINEFDTEEVGGISVAATDLVSSSRDAVKGYAEIVLGGQKVELTEARVKINDEDLGDIYEEYAIDVDFLSSTTDEFTGFKITYRVDENTVLSENGDFLEDVLFDAFNLVYEGLNDVEYSTLKITTDNDEVKFDGTLFNGKSIPSAFKLTTDNAANERMYLGSTNNRIYFSGSDLAIPADLFTANSDDAISYGSGNTTVLFAINETTTDVRGNFLFSRISDDDFYLYEITNVDRTDLELDFKDLIADRSVNSVDFDDVQDSLELLAGVADVVANSTEITVGSLGVAELYLENELTMNFAGVESTAFGTTSDLPIVFTYNSDITMKDTLNKTDSFTLLLNRAGDADDAIKVSIDTTANDFVSDDDVEEDSDFRVYVDHYGTKVTVEEDDFDSVTIEIPDEEVEAKVSVVFGDVSGSTMTVLVDADEADAKEAELEEDGYVIVGTKDVEAEAIDVDVMGVSLDSEVEGMENMVVVGGPAVNAVARALMGIEVYTIEQAGIDVGEAMTRYFEDSNTVLVYGYSAADTTAAVEDLNKGSNDWA